MEWNRRREGGREGGRERFAWWARPGRVSGYITRVGSERGVVRCC